MSSNLTIPKGHVVYLYMARNLLLLRCVPLKKQEGKDKIKIIIELDPDDIMDAMLRNRFLGDCFETYEQRITTAINHGTEFKNNVVVFDPQTSRWFAEHPGTESTIVKCEKCGLFYKPSLGHNC